jgi:hypothetical protein
VVISSRTPEGIPNRCPVCGKQVVLEPSYPAGDAPCSHCGHLLWFTDREGNESLMVKWPEGRVVAAVDEFDPDAVASRLLEEVLSKAIAPHLVLDFSSVGFLSSATLGKLITLHSRPRRLAAHSSCATFGRRFLRNLRSRGLTGFSSARKRNVFRGPSSPFSPIRAHPRPLAPVCFPLAPRSSSLQMPLIRRHGERVAPPVFGVAGVAADVGETDAVFREDVVEPRPEVVVLDVPQPLTLPATPAIGVP